MRRDGQFYLIDAFFAAAIVFVGVGFLVSDFVSVPRGDQARIASLDIIDLLFDTPIYDIQNPHVQTEYARFNDSLSPMEQVQVWLRHDSLCAPDCDEWSTELMQALVGDLLPAQHGLNISIDTASGDFVFTDDAATADEIVLLINSRRMLYTIFPDALGDDELLGPDLVEVRVWV